MSREFCSSARAAVNRPLKLAPLTPHFIVSVARGPDVANIRSQKELCGLRVSVETTLPRRDPCIASATNASATRSGTADTHPSVLPVVRLTSGECSISQQQLKCCSCRGTHTANYRCCAKWKDTRAALANRAPVESNKVRGTPRPSIVQEKRAAIRGAGETRTWLEPRPLVSRCQGHNPTSSLSHTRPSH